MLRDGFRWGLEGVSIVKGQSILNVLLAYSKAGLKKVQSWCEFVDRTAFVRSENRTQEEFCKQSVPLKGNTLYGGGLEGGNKSPRFLQQSPILHSFPLLMSALLFPH